MDTTTEISCVKGVVKSYSTKKGFGFIAAPTHVNDNDVFVYNTHLVGRVGLLPGEEVEFTLFYDGDRPQARNVRVTHAAPAAGSTTNAKENPFEALSEAILRPETNAAESVTPAFVLPSSTTTSPVVAEKKKEMLQKASRDAALKAQAALAVEVPMIPTNARQQQSDLEDQIRAAQTKAVDERQSNVGYLDRHADWAWSGMMPQENWGERLPSRSRLPIGALVSVQDFPAQDLVGQKGIVRDYDPETDRYSVEIEVPKKEGKEPATTKLSLRVSQLQIEKIPVAAKNLKESSNNLSALAEPFNPMSSMFEWAAVQALSNLEGGQGKDSDARAKGKAEGFKGGDFAMPGGAKGKGANPFDFLGGKGEFLRGKGHDDEVLLGKPSMESDNSFSGKGGKMPDFMQHGKGLRWEELLMAKGKGMPPFPEFAGKGMPPMDFLTAKGGGKEALLMAAKGDYIAAKGAAFDHKGAPFLGGKDAFASFMEAKGQSTNMAHADKGFYGKMGLAKGGKETLMMDQMNAALGKGDLLKGKGLGAFPGVKGKGEMEMLMAMKGDAMAGKFGGKDKGHGAFLMEFQQRKGTLLSKGMPPELAQAVALDHTKGADMKGRMNDLLMMGKFGDMKGKGEMPPEVAAMLRAKGADPSAMLDFGKGGKDMYTTPLPGTMPPISAKESKEKIERTSVTNAADAASAGSSGKGAKNKTNDSGSKDDMQETTPEKKKKKSVIEMTFADKEALQRYSPSLAGNPGYVGARWVARDSPDYPFVIVRATHDVQSGEIERLMPGDSCVQNGDMSTLESGVVRMPIKPEGWVSVHARLLNGPTFLDLATASEDDKEHTPDYSRSVLLNYGRILGELTLESDHGLASVRIMRMPELCKDHTNTAKAERREAREAKQKEREKERELERSKVQGGDERPAEEKGDSQKGAEPWRNNKDGWRNEWNTGGSWSGDWKGKSNDPARAVRKKKKSEEFSFSTNRVEL